MINKNVAELIAKGINIRTAYRRARIASRKTNKPIYTFSKGEYV